MMAEHDFNISDRYYDAVANGIKTFEIRKSDRDRIYKRCSDKGYMTYYGDNALHISVTDQSNTINYLITSRDFPDGINDGYCILGIRRMME